MCPTYLKLHYETFLNYRGPALMNHLRIIYLKFCPIICLMWLAVVHQSNVLQIVDIQFFFVCLFVIFEIKCLMGGMGEI